MIIHLDTNFIKEIDQKAENEKKLFNEFFEKIWIALKEGKHIVSIDKPDIISLSKYSWVTENNKKSLTIIKEIKAKSFQSLENLMKKINPSDIVIVTYDYSNEKLDKDTIFRFIPYKEFIDSDSLRNTVIVSEHIQNDGSIYKEFFPEIYKNYISSPFKYNLRKEMGGGNPIFTVLEERCKENFPGFYLFIVDSDKVSPGKPGKGETAKKIDKAYKKCKETNYANYLKFKLYILEVKDLENLIPLKYLQDYCENFYKNYKKLIEINDEIIYYFDIKNGVFCFNRNCTFNSIEECENTENCDNNKKYFCELLKQNNMDFFNENRKCQKLLESFYNSYKDLISELVDIILQQCEHEIIKRGWIELGRVIYSWGIKLEKIRNI